MRPIWIVLALFCAAIAGINGSVRALGGDVDWLSVVRVSDRADALGRLGLHQVRTIFGAVAPPDPARCLRAAATRHGVRPGLLLAVARAESDLVPTRISGTGAMGLMQLMPDTADELGVADPFDADQSAHGGARYLKRLLLAYGGDVHRALSAYNAGPSRVPLRGPLHLPEETRRYVSKITSSW